MLRNTGVTLGSARLSDLRTQPVRIPPA